MRRKTRQQKANEYSAKFDHIPKDYYERLEWLYDHLHLTRSKCDAIIANYNTMRETLEYSTIFIVLYEVPEGSPRPRFRLVNRQNLANMAMANSNFVHVYSPSGAEDNRFMRRLTTTEEFDWLNHVIYTPCIVKYSTFFKTPSYFNAVDTYLAELGVHTPLSKPDWDNIGKKYSDMSNSNLWLDDRLVVSGTVEKWYSVLPRVEIRIDFLNMLTTHKQYNSIVSSYDGDIRFFGDGRNNINA